MLHICERRVSGRGGKEWDSLGDNPGRGVTAVSQGKTIKWQRVCTFLSVTLAHNQPSRLFIAEIYFLWKDGETCCVEFSTFNFQTSQISALNKQTHYLLSVSGVEVLLLRPRDSWKRWRTLCCDSQLNKTKLKTPSCWVLGSKNPATSCTFIYHTI